MIDLHGRIDDVVCVGCHRRSPRSELQHRLSELNPGFVEAVGPAVEAAPDGDAELAATDGFRLAACTGCGGLLKPDVVFFGENVPRERVDRAFALVDAAAAGAGALLVAGSSLTVMSGLRFVRHAHRLGMPVVIVNRGATRGDELATLHVDAGCSEFLSALAAAPELRGSWVRGARARPGSAVAGPAPDVQPGRGQVAQPVDRGRPTPARREQHQHAQHHLQRERELGEPQLDRVPPVRQRTCHVPHSTERRFTLGSAACSPSTPPSPAPRTR